MTAYDKEAADNGNRVTTKVIEGKATPHTASADKGSEKPGKKQKKQIVFDKAKEIADKEKKKRKAEDDKPKQKPLTPRMLQVRWAILWNGWTRWRRTER